MLANEDTADTRRSRVLATYTRLYEICVGLAEGGFQHLTHFLIGLRIHEFLNIFRQGFLNELADMVSGLAVSVAYRKNLHILNETLLYNKTVLVDFHDFAFIASSLGFVGGHFHQVFVFCRL